MVERRRLVRPRMHPTTAAQLVDAGNRWRLLKRQHDQAAAAMWIGLIASAFTDHELLLMQGSVCVRDRQWLRRLGRDVQWTDGWEDRCGIAKPAKRARETGGDR